MNRARLALGLFRNNGDGTFTDLTRQVGLEGKVIFAMGSNFGDLDNDGWLDFYVGTGNPDLRSIIPMHAGRDIAPSLLRQICRDIQVPIEDVIAA